MTTPNSLTAWQQLVRNFADGRQVCNCGNAYYSPCGVGIDKQGRHRTDMPACRHGCSANQISAQEEIASKMSLPEGGGAVRGEFGIS